MIKTWQQRCQEHPDHEGIVTEQMIRDRMQEEIDELRQALDVDAVNITQERVDETAKGEHEPVAWRYALDASVEGPRWIYIDKDPHQWLKGPSLGHALIESLYTAPPQKEWVGLTDEDKEGIKNKATYNWDTTAGEYASEVQALTEAKLREKNNG